MKLASKSQSLLALALLATLAACGNPNSAQNLTNSQDEKPTAQEESISRAGTITVQDAAGNPIANAGVLIGQKQGSPFNGNFLKTDSNGRANLPAAWNTPLAVTIEKEGFVRATFFGASPKQTVYQLHRSINEARRYEVRGQTNSYPNLSNDGFIDMALVFPAFSRADASLFNLAKLISPETDTMSVFGQKVDLPSNTSLPTQRETYIFPITFSKPVYRMYVNEPGEQKVVAANVRFNLREVKGDLEAGTPLVAMANKISFISAGVKDVKVSRASTTADIAVNQTKFTDKVQVSAPDFNSKYTMLALSLPESNGMYYVADMKRLEPNQKRSIVVPGSNVAKGLVVSVLTKNLGNEIGAGAETMSAITTSAQKASGLKFLPIVAAPKYAKMFLTVDPPRDYSGVTPLMTYAVLSKVEVVQNETVKLEKKSPQWELYSSDWAESFDLPDFPSDTTFRGKLRWEATFAASTEGTVPSKPSPGPGALEKATHVTRSAVDLY